MTAFRRRLVAVAGALVIAAFCPVAAQAAWGKYGHPWDLKFDPYDYVAGFHDAVALRMLRHETGQSYFEYRGGDFRMYGRPKGSDRLCTLGDMPGTWREPPLPCRLTTMKVEADCRIVDGCAILTMDPAVLRSYRVQVVEALENPCGSFDDADAVRRSVPKDQKNRELRGQTNLVGLTIAYRWRLFECRSRLPIRAQVDLRDSDQGLIRLRF